MPKFIKNKTVRQVLGNLLFAMADHLKSAKRTAATKTMPTGLYNLNEEMVRFMQELHDAGATVMIATTNIHTGIIKGVFDALKMSYVDVVHEVDKVALVKQVQKDNKGKEVVLIDDGYTTVESFLKADLRKEFGNNRLPLISFANSHNVPLRGVNATGRIRALDCFALRNEFLGAHRSDLRYGMGAADPEIPESNKLLA